jgi:hypothetical protein
MDSLKYSSNFAKTKKKRKSLIASKSEAHIEQIHEKIQGQKISRFCPFKGFFKKNGNKAGNVICDMCRFYETGLKMALSINDERIPGFTCPVCRRCVRNTQLLFIQLHQDSASAWKFKNIYLPEGL